MFSNSSFRDIIINNYKNLKGDQLWFVQNVDRNMFMRTEIC